MRHDWINPYRIAQWRIPRSQLVVSSKMDGYFLKKSINAYHDRDMELRWPHDYSSVCNRLVCTIRLVQDGPDIVVRRMQAIRIRYSHRLGRLNWAAVVGMALNLHYHLGMLIDRLHHWCHRFPNVNCSPFDLNALSGFHSVVEITQLLASTEFYYYYFEILQCFGYSRWHQIDFDGFHCPGDSMANRLLWLMHFARFWSREREWERRGI